MAHPNCAAWLESIKSPVFAVLPAPYTPTSSNEVTIRTAAGAINPADVGIQKHGVLLTSPDQYPCILGCDVAGEVVELPFPSQETQGTPTGFGANDFKVGDRVIGQTSPLQTQTKEGKVVYCYSSFQEYVVLKAPSIAKIPEHMTFEDATVLPLGINTATSCLFTSGCLGLDMPLLNNEEGGGLGNGQQGKGTLLVWGASSSVGACGVQLATQAGYDVIGVAGAHNHAMVRSLGATAVFDHHDPNIVENIVEYLKTESQKVVGAYDAISTDRTLPALCGILDRCGGRKLIAAVMPGAEAKRIKEVTVKTNFAQTIAEDGMGTHIWKWLEQALQDGRMKCMPPAEVVGKRLEEVQKGVDLLAKGVSAKKLVVAI